MYGARFAHEHYNALWEYTIDLAQAEVVSATPAMPEASGALPMEYPVVSHRRTGLKNRYVYTTAFSGGGTFFDALQKYDLQTRSAQTRLCPAGEFPSEVAFVPSDARDAPEDAGCAAHACRAASLDRHT